MRKARGIGRGVGRGDVREYVSVSPQTVAQQADAARETRELAETPDAEIEEWSRIYVDRELAEKMAFPVTERDALGSHAHDDLGISEAVNARPI